MPAFVVTDSHAHWWPSREFVHQRTFWSPFITHLRDSLFREMGFDFSPETLERQFFDPEGRQLLASMEAAGIDRTVLLPLDWGLQYGEAAVDIISQNRAHAELADRYPGRFVPFFGIDPNRPDGDRHFQTAVRQWGMKGLKLYPPCGFFPGDGCCVPYYRICLDHDLPVVFHGSPSPMSPIAYTHPREFRRLAERFPALRIVIAHAGGLEWLSEAIKAYRDTENLYLDLSGWQAVHSQDLYRDRLRKLYQVTGSFERILFGTDNPIFNGTLSTAEMTTAIEELEVPAGEKENLLGRAAARLLGESLSR